MTQYLGHNGSGTYRPVSAQEQAAMEALLDVVNNQCQGMTLDQVFNCFLTICRATMMHFDMPEEGFRRLMQQAVEDNPGHWQRMKVLADVEGHA